MKRSPQLGLEESITDLGCSFNVTAQEIQQKVARVSLARRRKYEHELRYRHLATSAKEGLSSRTVYFILAVRNSLSVT
jgi:hypothetical protein